MWYLKIESQLASLGSSIDLRLFLSIIEFYFDNRPRLLFSYTLFLGLSYYWDGLFGYCRSIPLFDNPIAEIKTLPRTEMKNVFFFFFFFFLVS